MTDVDDALFKVRRALRLLQQEIEESPDPLLAFVPREQMILFRGQLEQMEQILRRGGSPDAPEQFGLAQRVIRNWPFTGLGEAIVRAERAYAEVQREVR